MPVVEGKVVIHQLSQDRHLLLGVIVEDLFGSLGISGIRIGAKLLMHKPLLTWGQLALSNSLVIRQEGAVEFDVIAIDIVVRIIEDGVIAPRSAAFLTFGRIRKVDGVAEWPVVDGITQTLYRLPSQKIVKGAVFHLKDDNILDLRFEVLNGP